MHANLPGPARRDPDLHRGARWLRGLALLLALDPAGAITFTPLPAQPPETVRSIAIDPVTGDLYASGNTAVIRSTDHGATWTRTAAVRAIGINTLYFTPAGTLYAGVETTLVAPAVGVTRYDKVANTWTAVPGAPLNVTALIVDGDGTLLAGTGTTGNFNPDPINFGTGAYRYDGANWTALSTGIPPLPGYAVLPSIPAFAALGNGQVLAATYGGGVLALSGNAWFPYGSGLADPNVGALVYDASTAQVFAGLDGGIARGSGGAWSASSTGLPDKPVRALAVDAQGKLYAGTGYYHWMDGDLRGEVYASSNHGASWQDSGLGYHGSDVLALRLDGSATVYLGSAGLWRSPDAGATWSRLAAAVAGTAPIFDTVQCPNGHLFAVADNFPQYHGYGGVFRSTDDGASWTQAIAGIQRHRGNFIFCDSAGIVWTGFTTMANGASNGAHRNGVLYRSLDDGASWHTLPSAITPSLRFTRMAQGVDGKLYLANGWGGPSNVSVSTDHATWTNTLNMGEGNGGMAFGLATSPSGHVFLGTETAGVMRAPADQSAPFTTVSPVGGNTGVFVDPYTGFVFGNVPGAGNGRAILGSTPADNGTNMFQFQNLPAYTGIAAMAFDNRGNLYLSAQSATFANSGLYTSASPWNTASIFSKVAGVAPGLSYYFTGMFVARCGALYGTQSGVYKSDQPVNTPAAASLAVPANGATGVDPAGSFDWSHPCAGNTYRLQVATDAQFTTLVHDVDGLAEGHDAITGAPLAPNTLHHWRVRSSNAAGAGAWTPAATFTTAAATGRIFSDDFED